MRVAAGGDEADEVFHLGLHDGDGAELAAACGKLLDQAEQQIVKLTKGPDGTIREVPFANEDPE